MDRQALGELLREKWTRFINKTALIAFVLKNVRNASLPQAESVSATLSSNVIISLSRIEPQHHGLLVWIEFSIPVGDSQIRTGTCEAFISYDNSIRVQEIVGQTRVGR